MPEQSWITAAEFAEAEGVSVQAARAALRTACKGRPWRGRRLTVRLAAGQGGRGGLRYEVESTLASGLDREPAAGGPRSSGLDPKTALRFDVVRRVLEQPEGSAGRNVAVILAAEAAGVSERSVYRWLSRYEACGLGGLARTRPANAGRPRVRVSRVFDRFAREAGCSEEVLEGLAGEIRRTLRGLWASRAEQAGGAEVRRLAEFALEELCEGRGLRLPKAAFRLSRRGVERFSAYRVVNQRRNDRKAFDDARPRIRRDWTALLPMERVVADVKHLDVLVRRPDGSPAWPKIVAFMDAGTGRVFVHPVLLEPGAGVRQEHVIEAFLAMVSEPGWGFPQGIYLDNGAEFAALERIDRALQLLNEPGARTVIYARPYNASAKPIESLFARLDRQVFSLLPGYAGPNRMVQKTQAVGRPPLPYPGDWDDFCRTLQGLIRAHDHRAVGGARRGRSPQEWLQRKLQEGWRAVHVDPPALDAAFSDPDSRRVDRGVLKIRGQRYTHERLAALPSRTSVDLALPWRRGARPLARLEGAWVYLQPETLYPARWIEGARESDRRQRAQAKHVAALAREAPPIDPVALKIRWGARQQAAPMPAPLPPLDIGGAAREQAAAVRRATPESPAPTAADLRRAREMALTEQLERAQRRHD